MAGNPLADIHFVLVESETAANVGAVCRAMKNMGFRNLHLVKPACDYLGGEARALAHSSEELLVQARIWNSFAEVREHFSFMVATTCEHRDTKKLYFSAENLRSSLLNIQPTDGIALVFGRERNGLTTEEIEACDIVSSIPLAESHPAINLSQAVMLYAYNLALLAEEPKLQKRDLLELHQDEHEIFRRKIFEFLNFLDFGPEDRAHREVLSRLPLVSARDKRLLMFLMARLQKKIPEITQVERQIYLN